ncbi:MAG: prepilin peptidase [Planctomycetaceae bacterium]|nr:prepilin peptidase [Planctomycetaceae bacterium]
MDAAFFANLPVKLVTVLLIWAAYIDGKELRVPNWLTFPMILSGIAYNTVNGGWGWDGFLMAFVGTIVGILTLLPLRMVGGMGMGDVKLMAGIGAWLGVVMTWNIFVATVIVGALMAIAMVLWKGEWQKHYGQFLLIWGEWTNIRNPEKLAAIAKERKPRMYLLPYGIPICVGAIIYFTCAGLYI